MANYDEDTVSVIDGKTNAALAQVIVGENPYNVTVNPNTELNLCNKSGV